MLRSCQLPFLFPAPLRLLGRSLAARSPDEVLRALSPGHAGHAEPSDEANDGGRAHNGQLPPASAPLRHYRHTGGPPGLWLFQH